MNEWIIVLIAVVVLFGGTQIPRIFRGLGQGIREFKTAVKDDDAAPASPPPAPKPPDSADAADAQKSQD